MSNEDNGDEMGVTIGRQRRKIYKLKKSFMVSKKWVKLLTKMICFIGLINIILVCMLLKLPRNVVKVTYVLISKLYTL